MVPNSITAARSEARPEWPPRRRTLRWLCIASIVLACGGEKSLPPALGGAFELIDQNGATVTQEDYLGQPALLYFGFTHCPDICPNDLGKIASVVDRVHEDTGQVLRPIFVTIDPERDTPERLSDFLPRFHASFVGLTGSPDAIKEVTGRYAVYYEAVPVSDAYTMNHSSLLFLLDPEGRYVAHYGRELPEKELVSEIKKAL